MRASGLARRAGVGALLLGLTLAGVGHAERSRYDELKKVIDRNTGFAHMTRGMNKYTVIALRECVTGKDVPVLTQLLRDRDHVTQLTAASVLVDMGEEGTRALRQGLATAREAKDVRTRSLIEDALREANSPTRIAIKDYRLDAQERKRIRGCAKRP